MSLSFETIKYSTLDGDPILFVASSLFVTMKENDYDYVKAFLKDEIRRSSLRWRMECTQGHHYIMLLVSPQDWM